MATTSDKAVRNCGFPEICNYGYIFIDVPLELEKTERAAIVPPPLFYPF